MLNVRLGPSLTQDIRLVEWPAMRSLRLAVGKLKASRMVPLRGFEPRFQTENLVS